MPRTSKVTAIVAFLSLSLLSSAYSADETITITTYYPSPTGSYKDLETGRLAVGFTAGSSTYWDNFVTVNTGYNETVGIGGNNAGNDIEIRTDADSTRNTLRFTNVNTGTDTALLALNIPGCVKRAYTTTSGNCACGDWNCNGTFNETVTAADGVTQLKEGTNYYLSFKLAIGATYSTTGWYLCCQAKELS